MSSRAEKYFESTVKEQSGWQAIMNVFKTLWEVFVAIFISMGESVDGEPVLNETHFMRC